jgi:2-polyprenyl-3-methyl-5-hydroxy-6-metoxy-1,4-benzoquinol methylase
MRLEEFRPGEDGHVSDGVLICSNCQTWYPIDRDVLEFVPPALFDAADLSAFYDRYADQLRALSLEKPAASSPELYADQIKQREHFDLYAEGAPGFSDYTVIPFIRATTTRYTRLAGERLTDPDAWLLDIGCGVGALSFPLMNKCTVIAFDVSRKAVRRANEEARAKGLMKNGTFYVGDGSFLPFLNGSFDHVNTLGVLHHLPNPKQAIADIQRILKPGGVHFAIENNKSAFRRIFDLLMEVRPLWIEEAGTHPLISRQDVLDWTDGLPVRVECETSVFLPPQLLNPLGRLATPVVELSDQLFSLIPIWNRHGGQIIFSITKTG